MRNADLTSRGLDALGGAARLMDGEWAPCRWHCPVHADVRAYIDAAARGQFDLAIDTIRRHLPYACICGRICHHPCEANCRRRDVDEPVAIRELKRFVAELAGAKAAVNRAAAQDKARVAVIGAGPAGLSAALELARKGYRPVVFERHPTAGGIPATAIPAYRLPRDVVQMDVDWIAAHGVEIRTGVTIGQGKTIADLLKDDFAAVLIAAGLAKSRLLPMPGAEHPRVIGALDLLTAATFGPAPKLGRDVLVIGGGNVAVDAARTALRLGGGPNRSTSRLGTPASRVRMACLEDQQEMPAYAWEQAEAREEGIEISHRRGPVAVVVEGGRIVKLRTRKVTRVFDEAKRFNPAYDDGDVLDLDCDTVIVAIGQAADYGFLAGSGLRQDERGLLVWNPLTHQTSQPNIFACGEIVTPPGSAVEACANGQRAARAIDQYLSGQTIVLDDSLPACIDRIEPPPAEKVTKVSRTPVEMAAPEARTGGFGPIDRNYAEAEALREARRCMNCGAGAEVLADKCAACLTCVRVCPFGVPKLGERPVIESHLCQACGMCIAECPAVAIVSRGAPAGELRARAADAMARTGRKVVALVCGHHASAADWKGSLDVPGVVEVYIPSVAGVSVGDMLKLFEDGAEGVLVAACRDGADRYPKANARLRARVRQARQLLREAGWPAERLKLVEVA